MKMARKRWSYTESSIQRNCGESGGGSGRGVGLTAQQRDNNHARQESEEESGARADQSHGGSAAREHRETDCTSCQVSGDGGTRLTPRQHQTSKHHHESL